MCLRPEHGVQTMAVEHPSALPCLGLKLGPPQGSAPWAALSPRPAPTGWTDTIRPCREGKNAQLMETS